MRRRSKPRVVWLPPDPSNRVGNAGNTTIVNPTDPSVKTAELHWLAAGYNTGDQIGVAVPLVGDAGNAQNYVIGNPTGLGTAYGAPSFADLFSSGYRLRRICGAISVFLNQYEESQLLGFRGSCAVTAAFQVMRVDSAGLPVDTQAANTDAYNTQENPWIWRRTWYLTNFASLTGQRAPYGSSNNFGGGSMREGQFVDQKTARIVGPDERLFMCVTATTLNDQSDVDAFVGISWDLRVLASLKSNLGNRRNASR